MFKYEPLKDVKRSVIVDTDIGPDVDDVGALVVLFKLAEKYDIPVLGVVNCTSNVYGNGAIDAVARYCGAGEITIGQTEKKDFLDDETTRQYNRFLTQRFSPEYGPEGRKKPEDATKLYRRLLAAAEDKSVVIVTIGPLNNMGALMRSTADEYSPLDGCALIEKKVHAVVTMGGSTEIHRREYNIVCDGEASALFAEKLPVPVIFSGVELGERILVFFHEVPENAEENPIYIAYHLYSEVYHKASKCCSCGFDLTAVQFAFEGEGEYYRLSAPGTMKVFPEEDYATEFAVDPKGTHYSMEVVCSNEKICSALESFVLNADKDWKAECF